MRNTAAGIFVALAAAALAGCGEDAEPDAVDDAGAGSCELPDVATYGEHAGPLLDEHCTSCHAGTLHGAERNGAPEGVDFDTYEAAVESAAAAAERIRAGTMPPAGGLESCQRELFDAWVDGGVPP